MLKIQRVDVYWTPRCNAGFHKSYTILTYDYMKMIKIMKSSTNIIIECYFDVHISIRQIHVHVNCVRHELLEEIFNQSLKYDCQCFSTLILQRDGIVVEKGP